MAHQWTKRKRVAVMFDNNNQAIGPSACKFNNFLGTLVHRSKTINDDFAIEES